MCTCVRVDEVWLHLIRGQDKVGSVEIQHKSHILNVLFVCAVSRPDISRDFHGKIGIKRVCLMRETQRTTAH